MATKTKQFSFHNQFYRNNFNGHIEATYEWCCCEKNAFIPMKQSKEKTSNQMQHASVYIILL